MKLVDPSYCTGCGACIQSCPRKAISYTVDTEGFPTPIIDNGLCVNCRLCEKVCPALHMPQTNIIQTAYAAQILDADALKKSTSGGLFTIFSRETFRRGGVVFGCVWDKDYRAYITEATSEMEIEPMRGSKYVWSHAGDMFPRVKAYLEQGKNVLFSGLPCQIAGLRNYLNKDYNGLLLLDFLCSGTPSPLALDKYLETICKLKDRTNLNLKFRDKEPYGLGVHITYNGQKKRTAKRGESISNSYYYSFYSHLIDRQCCYKCPYGTEKRISDLTMSDFWGIERYHPEMNISAGVSALLVNTNKGAQFLAAVEDQVTLVRSSPENIGRANNLDVNGKQRNKPVPENRKPFFVELRESGWKSAERKYLFTTTRLKKLIKVKTPRKFSRLIRKIRKLVRLTKKERSTC